MLVKFCGITVFTGSSVNTQERMTPEPHSNVVRHLQECAERVPARTALIMPGAASGSITFQGLWQRARNLSAGFEAAGLKPGDRVICMIPMSINLYANLLGLLKMGAVVVFIDPWIGIRQIAAFASHASPGGFIGIAKSHLIRWMDAGLRRVPVSVTTGFRVGHLPARWSQSELEAKEGNDLIFHASPEQPALITFTSGSSGDPKGANRTHGFLEAQHHALRDEFPCKPDDVDMPMFPVFALNNLASGITSVVPDMDFRAVSAVDPERILAQMEKHGVTTSTASPPFFERLARHLLEHPGRTPRLRRILTGGAPVSNAQLELWHKVFGPAEIEVVYGSTEAEPVASIDSRERIAAISFSRPSTPGFCVGKPTNRIRTKVIRIHDGPVVLDDAGWSKWEVPAPEVGELVVSGAHVCRDYYNNPQAVAINKIMDPGGQTWHRMGDTGYFDSDGKFWLVGRIHSTIRRAARNIHPQLIEQAAAEFATQVAAVGFPDNELGEKVVLVLSGIKSGFNMETARAKLSGIGLPVDDIVLRNALLPVDPRHNSKIDYKRLKMQLLEHGNG